MASYTSCIANRQCFAHVQRFVVLVFEEILLTTITAILNPFATSDMASCTSCIANRLCFAHVRRVAVLVFEEILLTTITTILNYLTTSDRLWLLAQAALLTVIVSHTYGALLS